MEEMNHVACRLPTKGCGGLGLWIVLMDWEHNPPYFLVNRTEDHHPRVALEKDVVGVDGASIYYKNEADAMEMINFYNNFQVKEGSIPLGAITTAAVAPDAIEPQVMEFE